ncbi:platelet-activating factor acetylhydrolase-like [Ptychodera flava]|uniref:platelet-activating factor acetylhydrolase-like n=1 Tax=Ptychodera flava TaxID=63121 RepID=UPI00396A3AA4
MWPFSSSKRLRGIPHGTGMYFVGCMDIMTRLSMEGSFLRLYYPSAVADAKVPIATSKQPPWLPRREYSDGYADFIKITTKALKSFFHWLLASYTVPVHWKGPLLPSELKSTFPVVVFSHGLGANRTTYSSVCLNLASQGFIVAAVEHRDQSASATYYLHQSDDSEELIEQWVPYERPIPGQDEFPLRNRQVVARAEECKKAFDILEKINRGVEITNIVDRQTDLQQFKDRLDLTKAAIAGHSFGAATSLQTLKTDERFRCALALDTWMLPLDKTLPSQVNQPILFVNTETFHWPGNIVKMKRFLKDNGEMSEERKIITIMGTVHQSQSDFPFLLNTVLAKLSKCRGTLDPYVAMAINNNASLTFLCKHLDIPCEANFDSILEGKHDHVILGSNVTLDPNYKKKSGL